jgi:hypothetical protein
MVLNSSRFPNWQSSKMVYIKVERTYHYLVNAKGVHLNVLKATELSHGQSM